MEKNIILKSFILLALILGSPMAYAQKNIGKSSEPRTETVPVIIGGGAPEEGSGTPTPTPVPVEGTNVTNPGNNSSGVQGTSQPNPNKNEDKNGKLGDKSQVGGVSQEGNNNDKGKSGGKTGQGSQGGVIITNDGQNNVPVNAVGGENPDPIIIKNDGPFVTPPLNPGGTEVQLNSTTTSDSKVDRSPAVVGEQTSKTDEVVNNKSCEDEALQKIYQIIQHDNANVLGKMFELTTLRVARKALSEGNITLEGYTRNRIVHFEKQMNEVKGSEAIQKQIKAVYETYGKPIELQDINKELEAALKQGKQACYWSTRTHLWNTDAASYILAASLVDKDSGLTDADAAVIWTVEKIRKAAAATDSRYKNGQALGNLMNISNRVARYLGGIQGGKSSSKEELDQAIGDYEQELVQMMSKAYAQVKESLFKCIDDRNKSCEDCAHKQKEQFEHSNLGLDQIQRGLMQAVAKQENIKVEKALKGKMGNINFDFSNIAKGTVIQAPERMNKFDACGQPKFQPGTQNNVTPKEDVKKEQPGASTTPDYFYNNEYHKQELDALYVAPPSVPFLNDGDLVTSKKMMKAGYQPSVNFNPLGVNTSFVDPRVHPNAYGIDQLPFSPIPLGSVYVVSKDTASRNPATATKMALKTATGYYLLNPLGYYDFYQDLNAITK